MHHNHIVPVFLLGEQDGEHYIVSKFIAGQALSEVVSEEGIEPGRAAVLVIQLLEALAYAHEMDVLHRDVKPSNAILDAHGQLFLMDFGLAGWVGQETGRMTQDGSVMGTPAYMAPEQARGDIRQVGPAADQYSAGVVLYELLTGHLPFEGGPTQVVLYNILNSEPPPPSEWRDDLDPALEEICLKASQKGRRSATRPAATSPTPCGSGRGRAAVPRSRSSPSRTTRPPRRSRCPDPAPSGRRPAAAPAGPLRSRGAGGRRRRARRSGTTPTPTGKRSGR